MTEMPPVPPSAARRAKQLITHGHVRTDDYFWLRQKESPEVIAYLEAENAYAEAMMAHTEGLQEELYREMVGRIQETDQTAPVPVGDYFYYSRTEEGKQYSIYCRKQGSLQATEEMLLDLNEIAEGNSYLRLGIYKISPDHRLLAYSLDTNGAEDYVIYFKDLERGRLLPDEIANTYYSAEWGNDSQTLFYTTKDKAKRPDRVWRHRLGDERAADEQLFQEGNERFWLSLYRTKDRRYVMLHNSSKETSECHYLDANRPEEAQFTLIHPRQDGIRYHVAHRTGTFFILTNDEARNYRLMTAPVEAPGKENWLEEIPHREEVKIDNVDLFVNHLVLYERSNGLRTLRVIALDTEDDYYVTFPEPVYTYAEGANPEFDTHLLRFTYESLSTPDSVYDFNMRTRERELIKKQAVLGGYDSDNYRTERIFATGNDGTQIPISLVYHREFYEEGRSMPCLLYGYGSYGFSLDPTFNSNRVSLLDRGFIFAIGHVRGGQEMGRAWYDAGKFLNKRNTFTDFIACAHRLTAGDYTTPDRLAIMGGSAGGLLIGAVLNLAPELFQTAVAAVPFVDVVTTMLDESIPLTVAEFEEWGNPQEKEYYDYMLSYSPYDNVAARDYPHLLITAGLNDPRVQYWEPAKWAARLRHLKTDNNRLLLKTEMGAGHAGPSGRYDYLKEIAFQYSFILDTLDRAQ